MNAYRRGPIMGPMKSDVYSLWNRSSFQAKDCMNLPLGPPPPERTLDEVLRPGGAVYTLEPRQFAFVLKPGGGGGFALHHAGADRRGALG